MDVYTLSILIFLVRIVDVTLGSVRTILIVKGRSVLAAMIGFVEVLFWFLVVREALTSDEKSLLVAFAYAAGYALGTYLGTIISEKFITGFVSVQVVLSDMSDLVVNKLRDSGYAVTVIETKGKEHDKYLLMMELNKKQEKGLRELVRSLDPTAFITVKESKMVHNGFFK